MSDSIRSCMDMDRDEERRREQTQKLEEMVKNIDFKVLTKEVLSMEPAPGAVVGRKFDQGKTRWSLLLEMKAAEEVAKVLTYGAVKYAARNYRNVPGWRWRYTDAAVRHVWAYLTGEKTDPETGFSHLSHAICCLLMALDNEINNCPNGDTEFEKK